MTGQTHATLTRYMLASAAHFAAGGMMGVIFPWIIVNELHETQARVGIAQALATLPMMLLVMVGGANADGRDLRSYLARLQLTSAMLPVALAVLAALHYLTFNITVAGLFTLGIMSSFIMPARDALLSHVAPASLGLARAAAVATGATFGGQLLGAIVGGTASIVGPVPLLCLMASLLATAAVLTSALRFDAPKIAPVTERERLSRLWHEVRDGFRVVRHNERLRVLILYLSLGGPLFNGMFLVGFPLIVRDVYQGDSGMLSILVAAFLIGLTISSFAFSRLKPVERPGRLVMLLSPNNIIVFTLAHFAPPFPILAGLMFWWGVTSGIAMSVTRGMIQTAAPHAYRARVLSILQFANIAGGPPGALFYGFMAQWIGILNTMLVVPIAVATLWICFRFFSPLWELKRDDNVHEVHASLTAPPQ